MTIHASSCQHFHFVKALPCTQSHSVRYRVNTIHWLVTGCERMVFTTYSTSSSRNTRCTGKVQSSSIMFELCRESCVPSLTGDWRELCFSHRAGDASIPPPATRRPRRCFKHRSLPEIADGRDSGSLPLQNFQRSLESCQATSWAAQRTRRRKAKSLAVRQT